MRSNKGVILLAAAALVIIAIVAVALSRGNELDVEPGSPEAAVQDYVRAVLDGDQESAAALLTSDYQQKLERRCRDLSPLPATRISNLRVSLLEVNNRGETASVEVRITEQVGSGPFDQYQYSYEERFDLTGGEGSWLIDLAPWNLELCG